MDTVAANTLGFTTAMVFCLVVAGWCIHLTNKPQAKAEKVDPFVKRAMEELDEIDRIYGLLPPKEEPQGIGSASFKGWKEQPKAIGPVKIPPRYVGSDFWNNSWEQERKERIEAMLDCHCLVCDKPGIHTHWKQEVVEVRCDDGTSYMIGPRTTMSKGPG